MTKEDWEKGADKCSECGVKAEIICNCEVNSFRKSDDENDWNWK